MSILTKAIRKHKNFSCVDNYSIKTSNLRASSQKDNLVKECDYDEIEDFCTLLAKTGKIDLVIHVINCSVFVKS